MLLPTPVLELVCEIDVTLGPIREMGQGRGGHRRIVPIIGGTVTGPKLSGRLLDVGADWQTIFAGGLAEPVAEPVIAAPVVMAPVSADWTGFYAGAQVGYGDVSSNVAGIDGNDDVQNVFVGLAS